MSKIRGIFPLFLATTFGIVNGVWVFGPAFKEQQQETEEQAQKSIATTRLTESGEIETLREAEAAASRSISTKNALNTDSSSSSWWPGLSLWQKGTNSSAGISQTTKTEPRSK